MKAELLKIIEVENELGEGVLWDNRTNSIWWTDIERCKIYCYQMTADNLTSYDTPERLCSFGFTDDVNWLIAAFETGFAFFKPSSGELNFVHEKFSKTSGIRFNDGRVGPDGSFWVGAMVENTKLNTHDLDGLYCLDKDLNLKHHFSGVEISNAICWSPDASQMYFADSPTQKIQVFDFNSQKSTLSNARVFVETSGHVYPDGAVTDADGNVWNAQWGGSKTVCYSPEGQEIFTLNMPVSQPTCTAFGGEGGQLLFVTSARQNLSKSDLVAQPNAGNLFIYKTDAYGGVVHKFKGQRP